MCYNLNFFLFNFSVTNLKIKCNKKRNTKNSAFPSLNLLFFRMLLFSLKVVTKLHLISVK